MTEKVTDVVEIEKPSFLRTIATKRNAILSLTAVGVIALAVIVTKASSDADLHLVETPEV